MVFQRVGRSNDLLLFGGCANGQCFDDTWLFHTNNGPGSWELLVFEDAWPSSRGSCSSVSKAEHSVVIFGGIGVGVGNTANNQMWTFDATENRWSEAMLMGQSPSSRHSAVIWEGPSGLYLTCGNSGLSTHQTIDCSPMFHFQFLHDGSRSFGSRAVVRSVSAGGQVPPGREGAFHWVDEKTKLYLFGGNDRGDLFYYDTGTSLWNLVHYTPQRNLKMLKTPGKRQFGGFGYDSVNSVAVLFGGVGSDKWGNYGLLGSLWSFDAKKMRKSSVKGWELVSEEPGAASSVAPSGIFPGQRKCFGFVVMPQGTSSPEMWLFGGEGIGGPLDDLWAFRKPAPPPGPDPDDVPDDVFPSLWIWMLVGASIVAVVILVFRCRRSPDDPDPLPDPQFTFCAALESLVPRPASEMAEIAEALRPVLQEAFSQHFPALLFEIAADAPEHFPGVIISIFEGLTEDSKTLLLARLKPEVDWWFLEVLHRQKVVRLRLVNTAMLNGYIVNPKAILTRNKKILGNGAFGTVVRHSTRPGYRLPSLVAVKKQLVIDPRDDREVENFPVGKSPQTALQVEKEIRFVKQLQHPNVLPTVGAYFEDDDRSVGLNVAHIVMPLCTCDLKKWIASKFDEFPANGPWWQRYHVPTRIRFRAMLHIAKGLKALSEQNQVHRDLCPENVLVRETKGDDPTFILCDFGLGSHLDTMTLDKVKGHIQYAPPSLHPDLRGDRDLAMSVDVYAFGILITKIWSGQKPYSDQKKLDPSQAWDFYSGVHEFGIRPELGASYPPSLQLLCRDCWSANAAQRPSMSEVVRRLKINKENIVNHQAAMLPRDRDVPAAAAVGGRTRLRNFLASSASSESLDGAPMLSPGVQGVRSSNEEEHEGEVVIRRWRPGQGEQRDDPS